MDSLPIQCSAWSRDMSVTCPTFVPDLPQTHICDACLQAATWYLCSLTGNFAAIASSSRLPSLLQNLTRGSMQYKEPHVFCSDELWQKTGLLAGWLFVLSPQWGNSVQTKSDTSLSSLYSMLDAEYGRSTIDGTTKRSIALGIVSNHVMQPAYLSFSQYLQRSRAEGRTTSMCAIGPFSVMRNLCKPHHETFKYFPPVGRSHDYDQNFVVDFLGCRQPPDTTEINVMSRFSTATRVDVTTQFRNRAALPAPWPYLDEEYFEFIDVLSSALLARDRGADSLTVVELGTGRGAPWATRAAAAWRQLRPDGHCKVGLAELDRTLLDGLNASLQLLGLSRCHPELWNANVNTTSLATLLSEFPIIDYMDVDVQGAELNGLLQARRFLQQRVRMLHIGTHSRAIHYELERTFSTDGWKLIWSFPTLSVSETPFGRIAFVDGVLTVANPFL